MMAISVVAMVVTGATVFLSKQVVTVAMAARACTRPPVMIWRCPMKVMSKAVMVETAETHPRIVLALVAMAARLDPVWKQSLVAISIWKMKARLLAAMEATGVTAAPMAMRRSAPAVMVAMVLRPRLPVT